MTALLLESAPYSLAELPSTVSWYDSDTECTMMLTRPPLEPGLWQDYLKGAWRSYRKHGVETALDVESIADGHDTALFYAAVDSSGNVVGGLRAKGPYVDAHESHALVEWAGQRGEDAVSKLITDRIPFGVVEMKTAWVTNDPDRSGSLTSTLARTAFPTMAALDSQFIMATAASHVLDRWRSSGGVVVDKIPATPYPNAHYRTKLMFWDRRTFASHAEPQQLAKVVSEMGLLATLSEAFSEFGMVYEKAV